MNPYNKITAEDGFQFVIERNNRYTEMFMRCTFIPSVDRTTNVSMGRQITVAESPSDWIEHARDPGSSRRHPELTRPSPDNAYWTAQPAARLTPIRRAWDKDSVGIWTHAPDHGLFVTGPTGTIVVNMSYFNLVGINHGGLFIRDQRPFDDELIKNAHNRMLNAAKALAEELNKPRMIAYARLTIATEGARPAPVSTSSADEPTSR